MPDRDDRPAPEASGPWCVYLLRCAGGTLYTGITNNLEERLRAHRSGRGAKYTRGRLPLELVHHERASSRGDAARRERQIRGLGRSGKLALVASWPGAETLPGPVQSRGARADAT